MSRLPITVLVLLLLNATTFAADWRQFRGPGGNAVGESKDVPTEWSGEQNVAWKTALPGAGSSSPITVGDRIYLTCYSGYAQTREDPGDMKSLMRHVVCLAASTGDIVWEEPFEPQLPESAYSGGNNSWHGYSTSTPTSDGEWLYVFFGKSGVYCLSLEDGSVRWHADVGSGTRGWGSGASPVLFENLLLVNASVESQSLVALDKQTGAEVWRYDGTRGAWNSPVLVQTDQGESELVLSLPNKIIGVDPRTGKELWTCDGIPDGGYVCPSVVAHEGVIYAIGGRKNTAIAVQAGGRGDVTESHQLWRTSVGSNVSSPIYYEGHLYWIHERRGTAYCLNAKTGEVVYQERVNPRPGTVFSSGIVTNGRIYYVSQHDGTFVLAASPEFQMLAHNELQDDGSRINASPVVSQGKLLIRSDTALYCLTK